MLGVDVASTPTDIDVEFQPNVGYHSYWYLAYYFSMKLNNTKQKKESK